MQDKEKEVVLLFKPELKLPLKRVIMTPLSISFGFPVKLVVNSSPPPLTVKCFGGIPESSTNPLTGLNSMKVHWDLMVKSELSVVPVSNTFLMLA